MDEGASNEALFLSCIRRFARVSLGVDFCERRHSLQEVRVSQGAALRRMGDFAFRRLAHVVAYDISAVGREKRLRG